MLISKFEFKKASILQQGREIVYVGFADDRFSDLLFEEPAIILPPSEETIARMNAIVKLSPFCYYYPEKENDLL